MIAARQPCIIPGCHRSRKTTMRNHRESEWICPHHWPSIDKALRERHTEAKFEAQKLRRQRALTHRASATIRAKAPTAAEVTAAVEAANTAWRQCVEDATIKAAMGATQL